MSTTTDITTLKINYLTQAQYNAALAQGLINENELYLTPSESKPAASGGIDLSLVTTGEKYTWNQKQDALVSGTNIKTINNQSILGSGNITITSGVSGVKGDSESTYRTGNVNLTAANIGAQAILVSGTNIKTINNESLLGSGNISVQASYTAGTGIDITSGVVSAKLNALSQAGIVAATSASDANKVWSTNASGEPAWRNKQTLTMDIDTTDSMQVNIAFVDEYAATESVEF